VSDSDYAATRRQLRQRGLAPGGCDPVAQIMWKHRRQTRTAYLYRLDLAVPPGTEVTWIDGGNGHGPSRLEQVVRSLPRPPGVGYVWVAGETRELRGVRRYLRRELGLPSTAYKTVGYWTDGAERWRAEFEALDAEIKASLEAIWELDADLGDIEIQYDERLARLGL